MCRIRQVQHVLNAGLRADFVAAELPEHLLLVVICLNAPAELVETERVEHHRLRTGTVGRSALLPGNAHVQNHRVHCTEEEPV